MIVNGDLNSNVNSEIIQGPAAVRGEIDQNINIDENIIVDFQENMLPEQIDIENSSFDIRSIPVENDIPSNIDMVNPSIEEMEEDGVYFFENNFNIPDQSILNKMTIYCVGDVTVGENASLSSVILISEKNILFSSNVINNSDYFYCNGSFDTGFDNRYENVVINSGEDISINFSNEIINNDIKTNGSITVESYTYVNNSSFFSNNSLTVNSSVEIDESALISLQDIIFNNIDMNGIIYSAGYIQCGSNTDFVGSAAAENFYSGSDVRITYDSDVVKNSIPNGFPKSTGTIINLKGWEESI